jgi:hypothetical protein
MDVTSECDLFNYGYGHRVNLLNYFSVIQKNGGRSTRQLEPVSWGDIPTGRAD